MALRSQPNSIAVDCRSDTHTDKWAISERQVPRVFTSYRGKQLKPQNMPAQELQYPSPGPKGLYAQIDDITRKHNHRFRIKKPYSPCRPCAGALQTIRARSPETLQVERIGIRGSGICGSGCKPQRRLGHVFSYVTKHLSLLAPRIFYTLWHVEKLQRIMVIVIAIAVICSSNRRTAGRREARDFDGKFVLSQTLRWAALQLILPTYTPSN